MTKTQILYKVEETKQVNMSTAIDIGTLIIQTSETCGGRPRIAGTRVSVQRIAAWYKMGLNPEEIANRIGHLTLAQIYAALTYYHANKNEIEGYLAAEAAEYNRLADEDEAGKQS